MGEYVHENNNEICVSADYVSGSLQAVDEVKSKKCNDLIMMLDAEGGEKIDGRSVGLGLQFIVALFQKTAPILVSSNIVENFCFWKTEYKEMLNTVKQDVLKTKDIEGSFEKAKQLFQKLDESNKFNSFNGYMPVLLSSVNVADNDWYCYVHKSADLVLFIPKKYVAIRAKASDIKARINECGFNVSSLDPISNVSPDSLLQYLQSKQAQQANDIVNGIESMLIPDNSSEDEDAVTSWNIYVIGHGMAARKKQSFTQKIDFLEKDIKGLEDTLKDERKDKTDEGKKQVKAIQAIIKEQKKNRDFWLPFLKKAQKLSNDAIIPESALIMGLPYDEFFRLMKFFSESMNVSFLFYNTCFSGGYNQALVSEVLWKLKADFIVATAGTNERTVGFAPPQLKFNENGTDIITDTPVNFTDFFGMLEDLFGEQLGSVHIKSKAKRELLKKAPIADIIGNVIDMEKLEMNQPFVRIPHIGVFKAVEIDKKVKVLTNSMVRQYTKEGKAIDFSESDIQQIVVYPKYIDVPLKVKSVGWLAPIQQKVTKKIRSRIHIFEEVFYKNWDSALCYFIADLIFLNSSYAKIDFVVKKLHCDDYENSGLKVGDKKPLVIENMVVQIKGNFSEETTSIDAGITVLFTCNQKNYGFSFKQSALATNMDALVDQLKAVSLSAVSAKELDGFAQKILDSSGMADIHSSKQEITPQLIVEQLQKKIGKEYRGKKAIVAPQKVASSPKKNEVVPPKKETVPKKGAVQPTKTTAPKKETAPSKKEVAKKK